jgi:hypothetical protein
MKVSLAARVYFSGMIIFPPMGINRYVRIAPNAWRNRC